MKLKILTTKLKILTTKLKILNFIDPFTKFLRTWRLNNINRYQNVPKIYPKAFRILTKQLEEAADPIEYINTVQQRFIRAIKNNNELQKAPKSVKILLTTVCKWICYQLQIQNKSNKYCKISYLNNIFKPHC